MNLNNVEYYYVRNLQVDIIGLIDKNGIRVVSYTYDTWGKLISIEGNLKDSVGVKNPYRYRGYRYDTETGLYYLQSRYYNSDWGRFINADGLVGTPGKLLSENMFAYCVNNPVSLYDPAGEFPFLLPFIPVIVTIIEAALATLATVGAVYLGNLAGNKLADYVYGSSKNNKSRSKPKEEGEPNSVEVKLGKNGDVEKYTEYDSDGNFEKEVRLKGQEHGNIERPNTKVPKFNTNPITGEKFKNGYEVRPSTSDEINMKWPEGKNIKWDVK